MTIAALFAGLVAGLLAAEAPAPALVPEAYLPDTTLGLFDVELKPETIEKAQGTSLWKLWKNPEVQKFLEKPLAQIQKDFEVWVTVTSKEIGFDLRQILTFGWPRRLALAIPEFNFEDPDLESLVLFADLGSSAEAARASIEQFAEAAEKKAAGANEKIARSEREGPGGKIQRLVRTYKEQKPSVSRVGTVEAQRVFEWSFQGSALIALIGKKPESEALRLERYLKPEKPLSADPEFQMVRARLGEAATFLFVRVDRVVEGIQKAEAAVKAKEAKTRKPSEEETSLDLDALLRSLGVSSTRSVAWTQAIEGRDIADRWFFHAPEPREGLLYDVFSNAPLPKDRLVRFAPKTAQLYNEASIDLCKLWDRTVKLIELVVDDEMRKSFAKGIAAVEEKAGAKIPEILACFQPRLAVYSSVPATMVSPGEEGLILPLANAARLREILSRVRALPEVTEYLAFEDETHEGVELVKITFRNLPIPLMPSYAIIEDTLVITESPFALRKLIASLKEGSGSLADSEKFRSIEAACFPEGARAGEYMDTALVVERLYQIFVAAFGVAMGPEARADLARSGIDLDLLPSPKAVSRGLGLGVGHTRVDSEGIEYWGRSAFGGGVLGLYKTAVGVAVPFVVVGILREEVAEHYRKASRENMTRIHEACEAYRRTTGGGRYPQDLLELLNSGLIEASALAAPGDTERKTVENPQTGERIVVSYRYRPKGYEGKPPKLVLWEAGAWLGGESRLGLFSDGSISEIWSDERLEDLLEEE